MKLILGITCLLAALSSCAARHSALELFTAAQESFRVGDYSTAALLFRESALQRPASGTLQNLGNTEWQRGYTGPAILAWEQALWLNPFNNSARQNLRFARRAAQLESPELTWYEVVSTWLPVNWWAAVSTLSFWTAIAAALLPGILRVRKAVWHQAVAAAALAIFLLSVPALLGVNTRSAIGFVQQKDTPLLLTPTDHAQSLAKLLPGEPIRLERAQGKYLLISTNRGRGWVDRQRLALLPTRG